jgi:NADPH-dependent 2,4-dienoyl-CoA reductase/sulfur reductase-like enzyme
MRRRRRAESTDTQSLPRTESFTFDGAEIPFVPGQSIAAALLAADVRVTRITRGSRPRGLFCGIGACFDCLLAVNGQPNVRSCLQPARAGDAVQTQRGAGDEQRAVRDQYPLGGSDRRTVGAEVVVVGAGPAGLAAAVSAADSGADVVVVDAGQAPGGQYLRQPAGVPPAAAADHDDAAGVAYSRALAHPRVRILSGHQVWACGLDHGRPVLQVTDTPGDADLEIRAGAVVLAPGAYDRVLPFPGWDLPGVITAGAAQALLKSDGVLAGRRLLVAGTGPFLLVVAAALAEAGGNVLAVVEANHPSRWLRRPLVVAGSPSKLLDAARYLRILRRHRVPVLAGHAVTEITADRQDLRSVIEGVDEAWRVRPGGRRIVHADSVCVGFGFTPSVDLAVNLGCGLALDPLGNVIVTVDDLQRTGVRGVLAAGEITGVGGAIRAAWQGTIAGLAAAVAIGRLSETDCVRAVAPARRHVLREERFAAAMHAVYPVKPGWWDRLSPQTVLCRCEEVTVGRIRNDFRAYGADDLRSAKLLSRIGMGPCQGRMCGSAAAAVLAAESGQPPDLLPVISRPIVTPIPLGTLADPAAPR